MAVVQAGIYTYGTVALPRWQTEVSVAKEARGTTQWFPVRAMCRVLGVDEEKQVAIVKDKYPDALDEVPMRIATVGWRTPLCIKRKEMALWVGGIDPKRCKLSARGPLEQFRRDLLDAADRLFWSPAKGAPVCERASVTFSARVEIQMVCQDCGAPHYIIHENGETTVIRIRDEE
jgi:hypothetical protein